MCSMYMCMGVHDACYAKTAFIMDLSENCRNRQLTILTYMYIYMYVHIHTYMRCIVVCITCVGLCFSFVTIRLLSFFQFLSVLLPYLPTHPAIPVHPSCHTCSPNLPYLLSSSRDAVLCASWRTMEMALSVTRELQNLEAWDPG